MDSIQISIEAGEEQQHILISQLEEWGATGFEQTDTHLIAYFPALDFNSYEVGKIIEPYQTSLTTLEEQNWNAVWESNFQPVIVDDFCAIRAHFHDEIKGVEHEILITPKMSFGTGHHATTHMMIAQMRDLDFIGKKVFDFGTGTGILAILASRLGAAHVDAIDVDNWSIENAQENIEKNGASGIHVSLSTTIPAKTFDIILANINRNVILEYLPNLKATLAAGGYLLLSGLLTSDENDITEACAKLDLHLMKSRERNNWISLLMVEGKQPLVR